MTAISTLAIDRALDIQQRVDATDRLQSQRRDHARSFALRLASGIRGNIGQDKEWSTGMHPTCRLDDRPRLSSGLVQLFGAAIGIRCAGCWNIRQDAGWDVQSRE